MMRRCALALTTLSSLPALAADDLEPPVARCTMAAREILLHPWGWAGLHWVEDGKVTAGSFNTGMGFDGDIVSVLVSDDVFATILTYDKRRKTENAVIAFTMATESTLASGRGQGHCEVLK